MGVHGAIWGGVSGAAEVLSSQVVGSTIKDGLLVGRASVSAGRSWNWMQLHPQKPISISREHSGSTSLILWYPRLGLDKQHVLVLISPWQMFLWNGKCRWHWRSGFAGELWRYNQCCRREQSECAALILLCRRKLQFFPFSSPPYIPASCFSKCGV